MLRGFRFSLPLLAGALLASAGTGASAQNSVVAPPPPPREDTVGPEQLRDFSLGGSNTQRAEQAQQPAPQPSTTPPPAARPAPAPERSTAAPRQAAPGPATTVQRPAVEASLPPASSTGTASAPPLTLPPATPAPSASFDFNSPAFGTPVAPTPVGSGADAAATDGSGMPMWPWLLAFAAVIGGALFLWNRRRSEGEDFGGGNLAFAGGAPPPPAPRASASPPPVPAPAPQPAPAPAPSHPKGVAIVSTRLRPWLDVDLHVAAAVLTDEELQLHLQIPLTNSGSVPARQVGVEVVALNAGEGQDREVATFFARPDPAPQAAEMIAPLEHSVLQTVVRMPRTAFREYAVGDGRVVVPLVALNVAYRAGGNTGRTSRAFLIGRGSAESEKLGPLRTEGGAREFRGVAARALPDGVRR